MLKPLKIMFHKKAIIRIKPLNKITTIYTIDSYLKYFLINYRLWFHSKYTPKAS
jgi:hypothetical protein